MNEVIPDEVSYQMYHDNGGTARMFRAITPDDDTDLDPPARALFVGTGGNVVVHNMEGESVTITNVPDGVIFPCWVKRVLDTDTTADDIIAIYG